jgi:hypothetical protein
MDHDDPILDALLSEALGGHTPPDVTARVLQAWAAKGHDPAQLDPRLLQALRGAPVPPPVSEPAWLSPAAPPVQGMAQHPGEQVVYTNGQFSEPPLVEPPVPSATAQAPLVSVKPRREAPQASSGWLAAVVAASVLVAVVLGGLVAYRARHHWEPSLAEQPRNKPPDSRLLAPGPNPAETNRPRKNAPDAQPQEPVFEGPANAAVAITLPKSKWEGAAPASDHEIVAFVNATLRDSWDANKVTPAPPATDAEFCRRAYLRLIGRIPNAEELSSFTANASPDKRAVLVDTLLYGEQYAAEFERYWATQWSNTLIGRSPAFEQNGLASVEGLRQYLQAAIHANKPFDEITFELISATGSAKPGAPDFNGATNFLLASQNEDATLATSRTARIFLGKQLQCAQCHNHPFNEWTQHQFWALNAFFRQMDVERDRTSQTARLLNKDFRGESGDPQEADVFYEQRNGQLKVAYPEFVDGTAIPRDGAVREIDRRAAVAQMIAASDDLSLATVNRTWAHFLGYGFTSPVDDMGAHNPPTHPKVLDRLAQEFKAHNYDTKSLLRWIALSEPFGLSSKMEAKNLLDAPQLGTAPLFSRYYTRQMQAEELYESLVAAAEIAQRGGSQQEKDQARLAWLGQFSQSLKTDEGDEEHRFDGAIGQSLMMMNGELMQQAISSEHSELLKRVAASKMTPREKIEHLFLTAIARKPTKRELEVTLKLVGNYADVNDALSDVWWALLNSNEFILDH